MAVVRAGLDDLAEHLRLYDETLAGERPSYRLTERCVRSDGTTLWGDLSVVLLRDDEGHPLHLIGQINDVTALREESERLTEAVDLIEHQRRTAQAILDTVDLGLLLIDRDGHYQQSNRRHCGFLDLAYPGGHRGQAGQTGHVYAADGVTAVRSDDMPTVADLLLSAQDRDGGPVLELGTADLALLVRDAVEAAAPVADARDVELTTDLPAVVAVVVDHERIRQVVDNLVSNALKYTDPGGRVEVRVAVTADEVEISMTDTGIGMDRHDLAQIFTPFFRARGAQERMAPGAGLGLGIAQNIVSAHGGRIEVGSVPAVGTSVLVLLPRA